MSIMNTYFKYNCIKINDSYLCHRRIYYPYKYYIDILVGYHIILYSLLLSTMNQLLDQ